MGYLLKITESTGVKKTGVKVQLLFPVLHRRPCKDMWGWYLFLQMQDVMGGLSGSYSEKVGCIVANLRTGE